MQGAPSERLLDHVRATVAARLLQDLSDGQLLERFVTGRDEAAFAALLKRHAAMVLGVCRRVLRDGHAAEDVLQATFLLLARKAAAIRKRDSVGAWLHGVALRLAHKSAATRARADRRDRRSAGAGPADLLAELSGRELVAILDQELAGLPERYRLPLVLCHLEGRSRDEAAAILGWSPGQVKGRLERGRERLRDRLVRRGVALSTAASATLLSDSLLAGSVSVERLTELALSAVAYARNPRDACGVLPPHVVSLTEGAIRAMRLKQWTVTGLGVALTLVAAVAGVIVGTGPSADGQVPQRPQQKELNPGDGRVTATPGAEAAEVSRKNLKAIAGAMAKFLSRFGRFPLSAIYSADGATPLLSWRVGLLPFLGQDQLYREFKLNEPWDSPHNRRLIARMPAVYRVPGLQALNATKTYYQVFVGKGCLFEEPSAGAGVGRVPDMGFPLPGGPGAAAGSAPPGSLGMPGLPPGVGGPASMPGHRGGMAPGVPGQPPAVESPDAEAADGRRLPGAGPAAKPPESTFRTVGSAVSDVTDGLSYTLLIVEGETDVTWTKPEDIPYAAAGRLPRLGGLFRDVFHAAFADGAVFDMDKRMPDKVLRAAIVRDDGIPFDRDEYANPVLTTDPEALRRENGALEAEIARAKRELVELRRRLEGDSGDDPSAAEVESPVERLRADQKRLRRELESLRQEMRKLRSASKDPGVREPEEGQ